MCIAGECNLKPMKKLAGRSFGHVTVIQYIVEIAQVGPVCFFYWVFQSSCPTESVHQQVKLGGRIAADLELDLSASIAKHISGCSIE